MIQCPALTAGGGYIFRCPLEVDHAGDHRYANPIPLFTQTPVTTGETHEQPAPQA